LGQPTCSRTVRRPQARAVLQLGTQKSSCVPQPMRSRTTSCLCWVGEAETVTFDPSGRPLLATDPDLTVVPSAIVPDRQ
jgi:hypothetical protein